MNRRDFLARSAACSAAFLSSRLPARAQDDETRALEVNPITIPLPIRRKLTALQISDTHISLTDERDSQRQREMAHQRAERFGGRSAEKFLAALIYAREKGELFLPVGDLIDSCTAKNLDLLRACFADSDCFACVGNHEFYQWVGDGAKEDEAYKHLSFDRVRAAYPDDLSFCSREVAGINFVAFDDVFYDVADDLIDRIKAEAAKGLPIVALCHCPLYTPELFQETVARQGVAYIVGASDEEIAHYPQDMFEEQRTNETTRAFLEYLRGEKALRAILCGHLHRTWQGAFSETATMYISGAGFKRQANEIRFVPEA
ncbi:MAG: metallophosphoesterase [Thermoguttaceae bacterium]|nr:metallophosphoesterase [Thermoguttaceae bacterium]